MLVKEHASRRQLSVGPLTDAHPQLGREGNLSYLRGNEMDSGSANAPMMLVDDMDLGLFAAGEESTPSVGLALGT